MGFDANAIKFLFEIKKNNISLGKTLTLGRQSYQIDKDYLFKILSRHAIEKNRINALIQEDPTYIEPFLKEIGAGKVDSMDASSYESATLLHDLNIPCPPALKDQYDTIIDAGTLEHIFNFPVAIQSCMEMLKVNGHFIGITITNNFAGHGFYQFSPELFFRIFSPENGFETKKIFLAVNEPGNFWYEIPDPKRLQKRVIFENSKQTLLLILAKKIAIKEIFHEIPQQSDYEHLAWQGKEQFPQKKKSLSKKFFSLIPDNWKNQLRRQLRIFDPKAWRVFLRNTGSAANDSFTKTKNI